MAQLQLGLCLEVRQSTHPDVFRDQKEGGKTICHAFRKCIAKMAKLSQYCTSFTERG